MEDVNALKVNDKITFTSIDPRDNNTYTATITSLCTYDIASQFVDILPTYESIKKVNPTMDSITDLNYMILQHVQNGISSKLVMAKEWIEPSSLIIIDYTEYFDVRIFDRFTENDKKLVKDLLNSNGFKCSIL